MYQKIKNIYYQQIKNQLCYGIYKIPKDRLLLKTFLLKLETISGKKANKLAVQNIIRPLIAYLW